MTEITSRLSAALADRYVIERELDAGGMAVVSGERDARLDRIAALEALPAQLSIEVLHCCDMIGQGCPLPTDVAGWR
jgi:hypothetical protein